MLPPRRAVEDVPAAPAEGCVAICDIRLEHGGLMGPPAVRRPLDLGWRVLLFSHAAPHRQVLEALAAGGGCRRRTSGAAVPADKVGEHPPDALRDVGRWLLRLPGDPLDGMELKPQTAARLWARRLGLCAGGEP
ncbi:hypothetical protein [Actinomadura parmotrematis]|uniref:Uncharacterized protein n=1 Tax=Actinomadura parmotrematis TaxID=2864039 RepID=A0ABS7G2A5_9ACTN|nr:hypothetical protein [Actinomadura parmotrematis]MBW8486611.1 hypothetical protein [Actinomadura parmotrematis]